MEGVDEVAVAVVGTGSVDVVDAVVGAGSGDVTGGAREGAGSGLVNMGSDTSVVGVVLGAVVSGAGAGSITTGAGADASILTASVPIKRFPELVCPLRIPLASPTRNMGHDTLLAFHKVLKWHR